jgi:hypothetical protein
MSFLTDFWGGIKEGAGVNSGPVLLSGPANGQAAGNTSGSFWSDAGQTFFSVAKDALQSGSVKDAVAARIAQTPTAQAYAAEQKSAYINNLVKNPVLWVGLAVAVLVIGYFGFALGKR